MSVRDPQGGAGVREATQSLVLTTQVMSTTHAKMTDQIGARGTPRLLPASGRRRVRIGPDGRQWSQGRVGCAGVKRLRVCVCVAVDTQLSCRPDSQMALPHMMV